MNIRIRKMTVSDLEPLYKLLSNSKVMQYLEAPYTKEQTEQFLFRFGLSETPLIYAVEKDNDFIGYVIYHAYDAYSVAAEPPVRCGGSHWSGLSEPPLYRVYSYCA